MVAMINVSFSGPILSGQGAVIMQAYLREVRKEVGQEALSGVQYFSDISFKDPTPYYETQLVSQEIGDEVVVHDRGIIYGPWLEGTSKLNKRTSFKGYHMFRNARRNIGSYTIRQLAAAAFHRHFGG